MDTILRYRSDNFTIRPALPADIPVIRSLIRELADYENRLDQCTLTEEELRAGLFDAKAAEVALGEADGDVVSLALFYTNFSSFTGKTGLFLEDLYVKPKARGNGYGKRMMHYLADLAVQRRYDRLDWTCLDWNSPAITFYLAIGAVALDDKTIYRLSGDALKTIAAEEPE